MSLFNGPDYDPDRDDDRLRRQMDRIFKFMRDELWHTLAAIAAATGDPEASVSAQLRHLRKPKHGSHTVNRRRASEEGGLYEYQLIVNTDPPPEQHEEQMQLL